jgi:hypothetical protein
MSKGRLVFSLGILILGAAMLVISLVPNPRIEQRKSFPMQFDLSSGQDVLIEPRELVLDIPQKITLGSSNDIILRLEVIPNALFLDREKLAWTVAMEARLELAGITVQPDAALSEPYSTRETMLFSWRLIPIEEGEFRGTLWVYASILDAETGMKENLTLYALPVEVSVVSLLGMRADLLKWAGIMGILIGAFSLLPKLVEKWIAGIGESPLIGKK